jgi:SHS2 domain-containing protein
MTKTFEQLPDAKNITIRAHGSSKEELFEHALKGMFESIHPVINEKKPLTSRLLVSEGNTLQELLETFLSDCLYLASTNHEVYREIKILELSDNHLHASLTGTPLQELNEKNKLDFKIGDIVVKKEKNGAQATFSLIKIKNK